MNQFEKLEKTVQEKEEYNMLLIIIGVTEILFALLVPATSPLYGLRIAGYFFGTGGVIAGFLLIWPTIAVKKDNSRIVANDAYSRMSASLGWHQRL